jgi:uncharacterized protein YdeI (YjbR/CyaY-like superfamily)
MDKLANIPIVTFADSTAWQAWLADNHTNQIGVWIKIAKKGSGIPSVTHAQALDEALCYGWIDGMRRGLDEQYFLQKFTPRRKRSLWSKVNIAKVEALIADKRMQTPGLAEIELAKSDGRWDAAYESQASATIPDDLTAALESNLRAGEFFSTLTKAERYAILWRLMTAKTPDIRTTRLNKMIEKLASNQKV